MKLDPFIEAEEAAGHSVKHCCDMFEVSKSAYYQRKKQAPSARELGDADLIKKIREITTSRMAPTVRRGCTTSWASEGWTAADGECAG